MVKGDERSKSYRDRISHLKDYYVINELPKVSTPPPGHVHAPISGRLRLFFWPLHAAQPSRLSGVHDPLSTKFHTSKAWSDAGHFLLCWQCVQ